MSTAILLTANKLPQGTCFPGTMQELQDLLVDNIDAELPDSVTLFNYGPNTPPVDRQDQPWIRTNGAGQLLGIYTFTGGKWQPAAPPFTTGDVMMFSGSESLIVPPWYVCNGQQVQSIQNNQVTNVITLPDLRGRFIVGAGQRPQPVPQTFALADGTEISRQDTNTNFALGQTGGEEEHILVKGELPSYYLANNVLEGSSGVGRGDGAQAITAAQVANMDLGGNFIGHNNLPPYYALAYKMYISSADAGLT